MTYDLGYTGKPQDKTIQGIIANNTNVFNIKKFLAMKKLTYKNKDLT